MSTRRKRVLAKKQRRFAGFRLKTIRDVIYITLSITFMITAITHLPKDSKVYYNATHASAALIAQLPNRLTPTASPSAVPTPKPTIVPHGDKWDHFVAAANRISAIYNFPANVVIAQAALESHYGTSQYAVERNNFIGIGAVDTNPDEAFTFENDEQCIIEYMRIIKRNFPQAWDSRNDADQLIKFLENNINGNYYASDPDYVTKVESLPEWSN